MAVTDIEDDVRYPDNVSNDLSSTDHVNSRWQHLGSVRLIGFVYC